MFEPRNILVPTDFSEHSDRALGQALDIAEKYNAKIHLLHVIDRNVQQCAVDYCLPQEAVDHLERESLTKSREMMREEVNRIAGPRAVVVDYDVLTGVPYDMILKEEQDKGIDLIVIASHGRDGLLGHLMGSVADRVAEKAKSEVLIVKD
jgi:nucleotide-binding universal stress UspA family protein